MNVSQGDLDKSTRVCDGKRCSFDFFKTLFQDDTQHKCHKMVSSSTSISDIHHIPCFSSLSITHFQMVSSILVIIQITRETSTECYEFLDGAQTRPFVQGGRKVFQMS